MRQRVRGGAGLLYWPNATLVMLNASSENRDFTLPLPAATWTLELNTANPAQRRLPFTNPTITVASRSLVVFGATLEDTRE
jgi:glycogen operon protein